MSSNEQQSGARSKRNTPAHHLKLLEDLAVLATRSDKPQEVLESVVKRIAKSMDYDVCSLYSYDPASKTLRLGATHGLPPSSIGRINMQADEGLIGLVVQRGEEVAVEDALAHERFKFFPELAEEKFHSFLGVPIGQEDTLLGVLAVQTRRRRRFASEEVSLLRTAASQIRSLMLNAHLTERLQREETERERYRREMMEVTRRLEAYEPVEDARHVESDIEGRFRFSGLGASPGFGSGRAHCVVPHTNFADIEMVGGADPAVEQRRFEEARAQAVGEIEGTRKRMRELVPEVGGAIYEALGLVLADESFSEQVAQGIARGLAAESSLKRVVQEYAAKFEALSDSYLRERGVDVRDVGLCILRHLQGTTGEAEIEVGDDTVLVAQELTLSDLASVDTAKLCGIVAGAGGSTSHAAILAKSLEIPTVVGCGNVIDQCCEGDSIIVDGNTGTVYLRPDEAVWNEYKRLNQEYLEFQRGLEDIRDLPARTTDGHQVAMMANVGLLGELELADRYGAEGVGLYRSEFQFLSCRDFPSEEEQYAFYKRVIDQMAPRPVTIRTLDLGADKYPAYMGGHKEANPFLGWRSIRISLDLENLFHEQLRAILVAAGDAPLRILFPMITSLEEIRRVREIFADCMGDLAAAGSAPTTDVELGAMIEVPAAVLRAPQIVREVDFVSIGTNDLIQYTLAVDRDNSRVAPMYEPLHPAVLDSIRIVAEAAHEAGRRVTMCGEMAANPLCTLFLLGVGMDELSMGPQYIPVVKKLIRAVSFEEARVLADGLLRCDTVQEVKGLMFDRLRELGLIELIEAYN